MELLNDEKARDFSALLLALALHFCAYRADLGLRWRLPAGRAAERSVEVEFAATPSAPPPAVSPQPALMPSPMPVRTRLKQGLSPAQRRRRALRAAQRRELAVARAAQRAARRAEQARLKAERLAQAQAREERRRADISQELAALKGADETLSDAPAEEASGDLAAAQRGSAADQSGGGVSWSLDGPLGNRRLLKRAAPESPEWLARRGLELSVEIKFQVLADGNVKRGAVIKRTSGFPEVDRRALDALRRWRFEPLSNRSTGETEPWGVVTFKFLIS